MLDALEYSREILNAGLPQKHAETIASVIGRAVFWNVATKTDLDNLAQKIASRVDSLEEKLITRMDNQYKDLCATMNNLEEKLITRMDNQYKDLCARVTVEVSAAKYDMLKTMIVISISQAAAIVGLLGGLIFWLHNT